MNILLVTQWYNPVKSAASNRTAKIAKVLTELGHDVTVLTGMPCYPTGILPFKYRRKIFFKEIIDYIRVRRVYEFPAPNKGVIKRLLNNFTFAFSASFYVAFGKKYDLLIVSSPSFLAGITGLVGKLINSKFIFDVRDLWPDSAIELGFIEKKWIRKILFALEKTYYNQADLITTATASIQDEIVAKNINRNKVATLLNSVDTDFFKPEKPALGNFGFKKGEFVISFTGNLGVAQGLDNVIKAADILKNHNKIKFFFVGDGEEKEKLIKIAKKLKNVVFWPIQDQQIVKSIINSAQVGLIPLAPNRIFQQAMPSKLLEYLACGKPVLAGVGGTAKNLIETNKVGLAYLSSDPQDLADKILIMQKNPKQLDSMGKNARKLSLEAFSYPTFYKQIKTIMEKTEITS